MAGGVIRAVAQYRVLVDGRILRGFGSARGYTGNRSGQESNGRRRGHQQGRRGDHAKGHPAHILAGGKFHLIGDIGKRGRAGERHVAFRGIGAVALKALSPHQHHHVEGKQGGSHGSNDKYPGHPGSFIRTGLQQNDLAQETGERRDAAQVDGGDEIQDSDERGGIHQRAQTAQRRCSGLALNQSDHQK